MDTSSFASLVELLFTSGVVLGLAIWQLISVRREIARDKAAAGSAKQNRDGTP